jgi:microcin C transport system substrate-binding protein
MMAKGKPSPEELALLEPYRGKVPDEAFGEPWTPPVSDGSGQDRRLLRRAAELLTASGWTIKNRRRVNAKGEPLSVEFLFFERSFEPHHAPYLKNLAVLGIDARLRLVEPVQYRARVEDFDFDITVQRMVFALTPGDTLRTHFSSQSVTTKGSYNYSGVADPVVDALVERIIAAPDRTALHAACRALDRVLRAGRYWVPHWYKASHWIAYWDLFGRPAAKPRYARGIPETWWYDRAKASKIERPG